MVKKVIFCLLCSSLLQTDGLAAAPEKDSGVTPSTQYTRHDYEENREDLSNVDFDYYKMPFYTGNVFPEAQNAVYSDKFIPFQDLSIVLGENIDKDDIRLILLQRKLEKWGAKTEVSGKITEKKTQILLNVKGYGKPAPERAEGYSINCLSKDGKDLITVNGRDKRGLLWGIVSVLQLTKRDASGIMMRSAEINDYPSTAIRGFLTNTWAHGYELMIFAKMNQIVVQMNPFQGGHRTPGPAIMEAQMLSEMCYKLGFDNYSRYGAADGSPKFTASDEKDFQQFVYVVEKYYAANHHNLYWAYDDVRFPLPKQDKEKFGSAAETDTYAVNRLFKEVRKKYPDFKMVFCPPYYWTSAIKRSDYGESGMVYTKTIGEKLDPAIGIFWTGVFVGKQMYEPKSVAEISGLIKRKPWIFKNRPGIHDPQHRSWPTDEMNWPKWSYDGFLDDVAAYHINTDNGAERASMIATCADYMWNPKAYDEKRSVRNAVGEIFGPELFPVLKKIAENLELFEPYELKANALSAANIGTLEKALAELDADYEKALKINRNINKLTGLQNAIGIARGIVNGSKDPKILSLMPAEKVRDFALKETPLTKNDLFLSAAALQGGFAAGVLASDDSTRYTTIIYGSKTNSSTLTASFVCDPYPPSNEYELYISGKQASVSGDCKMLVKVNDKIVYEGPSGFSSNKWSIKRITIPVSNLNKTNTLSISNAESSDKLGSPWIGISYIVIKKL